MDLSEESVRVVFSACDSDGNGQIDKKELGNMNIIFISLEAMLQQLNLTISADEVMKQLDEDGNETISFEEFYHGFGKMLQMQQAPSQAPKVVQVFLHNFHHKN